jgi:hypothetical protein
MWKLHTKKCARNKHFNIFICYSLLSRELTYFWPLVEQFVQQYTIQSNIGTFSNIFVSHPCTTNFWLQICYNGFSYHKGVALFQLYHGENKFIFNEMTMRSYFVLDQQAKLDFYSGSPLQQQSAGRHVAPLRHIIPIPSQPLWTTLCSFFLMQRT